MLRALYLLLTSLISGLGRRVLIGAGLGLASGAITLQVINYYIGQIQAQAGLLGAMASILHIGGLDKAISIIIGACVIRASLSAVKLSLVKASK